MKFKEYWKKIAAMALVCAVLAGQTVWAQDMDENADVGAEAEISYENTEAENGEVAEENIESLAAENGAGAEESIVTENIAETEGSNIIQAEEETKDEEPEILDSAESYQESATEEKEEIIYIGYPVYVEMKEGAASVESSDDTICAVTEVGRQEYYSGIRLRLEGKKEGSVYIYGKDSNGEIETQKHITVKKLPDDAVPFKDIVLRTLLRDEYDSNGDGYISFDEMESYDYLYLVSYWGYMSGLSITDLSGLEYASALKEISLYHNNGLSNIDILFDMDLEYVDLQDTAVSDEDRFRLADFKDFEVRKGDLIQLPFIGSVFEDELQVEIQGEEPCFEKYNEGGYRASLIAVKIGTSSISIKYHDCSAEIKGTVTGIDANQELGTEYDKDFIVSKQMNLTSETAVLDQNGNLWKLYPEVEKVTENVKEYLGEWVHAQDSGADAENSEWVEYWLDQENNLWSKGTKIAENVVKFSGRYALDNQGVLTDIFSEETEQIPKVKDWWTADNTGTTYSSVTTYILKKDGTLWMRKEVGRDEKVSEFVQMDQNVQEIAEKGYLKNGQFYSYKDQTIIASDVTALMCYKCESHAGCSCCFPDTYWTENGYYTKDGHLHLYFDYSGETIDIGNVGEVKNIRSDGYYENENYSGNYYRRYLVRNTEDELFMFDEMTNETTFIVSDVVEFNDSTNWSIGWCARTKDGTYYGGDGNIIQISEESPLVIWDDSCYFNGYYPQYDLIQKASGERVVRRYGVEMLTGVERIWEEQGQCFALRTDGTIWNVTGVPEQILDLKDTGVTTGDINGDDAINLLDLMQCLNHVSKKSELTGDAFTAADINGDGKVDLLDLMRMLNYVSKKTSEL